MSRSHVVLLFVSFLLAGCSSGAVASSTAHAPTAPPDASAVSATATAMPLPTGSTTSPAAEAPPEEAVAAALAICASPECEYPRLSPGSVHLPPDTTTAADRWCVQARFTMEGQDRIVAILLVQEAAGSTSQWRPGEPQIGVGCETVE